MLSTATTSSATKNVEPFSSLNHQEFLQNLKTFTIKLNSAPKYNSALLLWSKNFSKDIIDLLQFIEQPLFLSNFCSAKVLELYDTLLKANITTSFFIELLNCTWVPHDIPKAVTGFIFKLSGFLYNVDPSSLICQNPTSRLTIDEQWDLIDDFQEFNKKKSSLEIIQELKLSAQRENKYYWLASKELFETSFLLIKSYSKELEYSIQEFNLQTKHCEIESSILKILYKRIYTKVLHFVSACAKFSSLSLATFPALNSHNSKFISNSSSTKFLLHISDKIDGINQLIIPLFKSSTDYISSIDQSSTNLGGFVNSIHSQYTRISSILTNIETDILSGFESTVKTQTLVAYFSTNSSIFELDSQKNINLLKPKFTKFFELYGGRETLTDCFGTQKDIDYSKIIQPSSDLNKKEHTYVLDELNFNKSRDLYSLINQNLDMYSKDSHLTFIDSKFSNSESQYYPKDSTNYDSNFEQKKLSTQNIESNLNCARKYPFVKKDSTKTLCTRPDKFYDSSFSKPHFDRILSKKSTPALTIVTNLHTQNLSLDINAINKSNNISMKSNKSPFLKLNNQAFDSTKISPKPTYSSKKCEYNSLDQKGGYQSSISNLNIKSLNMDDCSNIHDFKGILYNDNHIDFDLSHLEFNKEKIKLTGPRSAMYLSKDYEVKKHFSTNSEISKNHNITFPSLHSGNTDSSSISTANLPSSSFKHVPGPKSSFSFVDTPKKSISAIPNISEFDPYSLRRTFLRNPGDKSNEVTDKNFDIVSPVSDQKIRRKATGNSLLNVFKKNSKTDSSFADSYLSSPNTISRNSDTESFCSDFIYINSPLVNESKAQHDNIKKSKVSDYSNGLPVINKSHSFNSPSILEPTSALSFFNSNFQKSHNYKIDSSRLSATGFSENILKTRSFAANTDFSDRNFLPTIQKSFSEKRSSGKSSRLQFNNINSVSTPTYIDNIKTSPIQITNFSKAISSAQLNSATIASYLKSADTFTENNEKIEDSALSDVISEHLKSDFLDNELVALNGKVVSGTLRALVENMTPHHTSVDSEFVHSFLLTFHNFTTPLELLSQLFKRFEMEPPEELLNSPELLEIWKLKKQTPARIRVYNVLKTWIESYFYLDEDFEYLYEIERFLHKNELSIKSSISSRLLQLVQERKDDYKNIYPGSGAHINKSKAIDLMFMSKFSKLTNLPPPPQHKLNKKIIDSLVNNKKIKILDIHPLELARQLTIRESYIFCSIRPHELIERNINKNNMSAFSNIVKMFKASNELAHWVINSILSESNSKSRAHVLKYMIKVANECLKLNNFNSLFLFVSAFSCSSILRLKKTWALLGAKYNRMFDDMLQITNSSKNYSQYRSILSKASIPALPFLGIILTDLTFNNDGNPKYCRTDSESGALLPNTAKDFNRKQSLNSENSLPSFTCQNTAFLSSKTQTGETTNKVGTLIQNKLLKIKELNKPHSSANLLLNQLSSAKRALDKPIGLKKAKSVPNIEFVKLNTVKRSNTILKIEKKNKDLTLPRINFSKYCRAVKIIETVQKFQVPYNLHLLTELIEYLDTSINLNEQNWDEDRAYQRSLILEPRLQKQKSFFIWRQFSDNQNNALDYVTDVTVFCTFVVSNVSGVIPSAAAGGPYHSAKRTRLEYSTVTKTGLIEPVLKTNYYFNFELKKTEKNTKKIKKFEKNTKKNNMNTTPKLDPKNYTEVSIKHLLDSSEPQILKKICFGGSDKKIGCGWSQFSGDIDADIEYVSSFIGDIYASIQHDAVAKTTYFIFYKVEQAIQFMKTPIFVDERRVELYQTIKLEEGAQIISISSAKNLSTPVVVDEINKIFSPYGTIIDFSAFKNKNTSLFHTYGIKFLFKKNTEEFKIPEFIDIDDEKIALTYRGCVAACIYCKKVVHWRAE
ncbi:hypothetical protein BB561_005023, partial [Smittium simulii]